MNTQNAEQGEIVGQQESIEQSQTPPVKTIVEKKKKIAKQKKKEKPIKIKEKGFISSTYKTKKCQFYMKGACIKGDECEFSHDFPLEKSKKICKFFLIGACSKNNSCFFSHNLRDYPCKFFHLEKKCQHGNNCRFSHGPINPADLQNYLEQNKEFILELYKYNKLNDQYLINYILKYLHENPDKQAMYVPSPIPQPMINHQMPTYQGQNTQPPFVTNFHPQFGHNLYTQFHPQGYNFAQMQTNYPYPQQNYMLFQQPSLSAQMFPNNNNPHNSLNVNNTTMVNSTMNSNIYNNSNQKVHQILPNQPHKPKQKQIKKEKIQTKNQLNQTFNSKTIRSQPSVKVVQVNKQSPHISSTKIQNPEPWQSQKINSSLLNFSLSITQIRKFIKSSIVLNENKLFNNIRRVFASSY